MSISEMVQKLADDLQNYASTEAIFGEPIKLNKATVVPVCKMSVGYGGGGGTGEESGEAKGSGGGVGGGVKIEPAALIVENEGEVSVVSIKNEVSKFDSLIEMIPEAVEKITNKTEKENRNNSEPND